MAFRAGETFTSNILPILRRTFWLLPWILLIFWGFKICVQTDLEEAKAQEVAKLQNQLQALQSKVDETNALLVKEQEAAKKAIEEAPPVIQETKVLVEDTEKIESLESEVESLKVCFELWSFYRAFLLSM